MPTMMKSPHCSLLKHQVLMRPVEQQSSLQRSEGCCCLEIFLSKVFGILHLHPHPGLFITEYISLCFVMMQCRAVLDTAKCLLMALWPSPLTWAFTIFSLRSRLSSLLYGILKLLVSSVSKASLQVSLALFTLVHLIEFIADKAFEHTDFQYTCYKPECFF